MTLAIANIYSLEYLGGQVRQKRAARGIRETAKIIGISPTTLSKVENGHIPDIKTLETVCDWLGFQLCIYRQTY